MSLEDLQKKHREAAQYAMKMVNEKDPKRLQEMAEALQAKCADLLGMAKSIAAAWPQPAETGPETVVKLTPAQRERIVEQTKVGLESVTLRDTEKTQWSKKMASITPREVEAAAAKEAAQLRLISDTKTQVEKIIRELKKLDVPELAEAIAEMERDPTLGLSKKK
jgi:alpha-L-fucosidase